MNKYEQIWLKNWKAREKTQITQSYDYEAATHHYGYVCTNCDTFPQAKVLVQQVYILLKILAC